MTTTDARVETVPGTAQQLSRTQILLATVHVLREDGYDATTIRRIASRLDCAVGSIYRYFRDKRDLLAAVTEQMLEPVADKLEQGEGFEASVRRYHHLATRHAETYRLMFWVAHQVFDRSEAEAKLGAAVLHEAAQADTAQSLGSVPGVVRRIIDDWARLLGDAKRAERCWALVHGLSQLGVEQDALMSIIAGEDVLAVQAMPIHDGELRERLTDKASEPQIAETLATEETPASVVTSPTSTDTTVQSPETKPELEIVITMTQPPRPTSRPVTANRESDDVTLL